MLMPLTGIMICDYFLVRKQRIQLSHLYSRDKDGSYYFTFGVNWRAILVWMVCVAPAIPGMIDNLSITDRSEITPTILYYRGFCIFGFLQSLILYYGLMRWLPAKNIGEQDDMDVYGTFKSEEAIDLGITPFNKDFAGEDDIALEDVFLIEKEDEMDRDDIDEKDDEKDLGEGSNDRDSEAQNLLKSARV